MINYYCSNCEKIINSESSVCSVCGMGLKVLGKKVVGGLKQPEVTAIFETEKGIKLPVDKKGNVIDHNIYNNDDRGWKRAGHKIKDREVHVE